MKFKIIILALVYIIVFENYSKAQQKFVIGDLNPYFEAYVNPFAKAMAVSMNGGWTHSASTHELFGFDFSLSASYVKIPESEKTFNPQKLDIPGYYFRGRNAPTISSDKTNNLPTITKQFTEGLPFGFTMDVLEGMNLSFGAMAHVQIGVGLPKKTEIILRFIPDVSSYSKGVLPEEIELQRTGMVGFGAKHDIKQWIPYVKDLPYLEISGLAGYSNFYSGIEGTDMQIDPDMLGVESNYPQTHWNGQHVKIGMSSWLGSILIGGEFPILQPFVGIGYSSSAFKATFKGNYPIVRFDISHINGIISNSEADPLTTKVVMKNKYLQAGTRLKLGFFVLHYSVLIQEYLLHNAGIAITFN